MPIGRFHVGDCGCTCTEGPPPEGCYAYGTILSFGDSCITTVFVGDPWTTGSPITGCFPFATSCGGLVIYDGLTVVGAVVGTICYDAGTVLSYKVDGYALGEGAIVYGDGYVCFPDLAQGTKTICVVGCDGEPLPGATITLSSEDPSGPFSWPPVSDPGDPLFPAGATTDENGCIQYEYPVGLADDAPITVKVNAPDQYEETTIVTSIAELLADGDTVTPDVAEPYTCCDMDFRQGPLNPSAHNYLPRADTLLFATSGAATPEEIWEVDVDCDGTGCSLSDEIDYAGGPPTVVMCPPGLGSDTEWDHWQPPTIGTGRVPMEVRVWYDGTDWHCQARVRVTQARPPSASLGGCDIDPTLNLADFYKWVRSDASCVDTDDPKLTTPPDPELEHPIGLDPGDGGSWYGGSTADLVVTATSYDVNTNNPVDITFHFDPVTFDTHAGPVSLSIVSSITVWQPV